jgi:integrase
MPYLLVMASLHRDPRGKSPYWYVAYRLADGRRTLRSTKERDFARAKIKAEAIVRFVEEESRADTNREFLNRIVEDTLRRLGHDTAPLAGQWLTDWLAREQASVASTTYAKYSHAIKAFIASLGQRAKVKLSAIVEADCVAFRDKLLREGRAPSTVNLMVCNILKQAFKVALDSGLISRNPVALIRPLRTVKTAKGTFSMEQVSALLTVAADFCGHGDWKGMILGGLYTGARIGDLAKLQWASVDLASQTITFTQGKTGGVVRIPMRPELREWLRAQRQSEVHVFTTLCKLPVGGPTGLSSRFGSLMRSAGIVAENAREARGGVGRKVTLLSFHSFRHTFNSMLANAGVSQELRQAMTGHASAQINDKYTHLKMASLSEAVSKLPGIH